MGVEEACHSAVASRGVDEDSAGEAGNAEEMQGSLCWRAGSAPFNVRGALTLALSAG